MPQEKYILLSALSAGVVLLAGCTTQTATDITVNTAHGNTNTEGVANTNATDTNTNTNITGENGEGDLSSDSSSEVLTKEEALSPSVLSSGSKDEVEGAKVDTSDWKTYKNETLSLSFKYPQDWELERTQVGKDFTEILDNNNIYDHQLVNIFVHWSDRHENIVYDSGLTNPTLDQWLSCDYVYDLQSECSSVLMDGIEVIKREGQIEPPFGDDYVALAYKKNNFTVVIDTRSLFRESSNNTGNINLDGLQNINGIIETMSIN